MSDKNQFKVIQHFKDILKCDDTVQKMFAEHGVAIELLDYIPVKFDKLDVSAKTDHGIVLLNNNLLNKPEDIQHYMCHEFCHWLQQSFGEQGTQSADDGSYLDNPYEQEAFKNQVRFIANNDSESEAEDYVDGLLDHHNIDGKERNEKEDVLLSDV